MSFWRWLRSRARKADRWYFVLEPHFVISRHVVLPGERLTISGAVRNVGRRLGTVYVIIKIASSYDHGKVVFDSDDDVYRNELRLVDIPGGSSRGFTYVWRSPADLTPGHYDISIEVWTPPKLFRERYAAMFDKIPWRGMLQVVGAAGRTITSSKMSSFPILGIRTSMYAGSESWRTASN
jgi:hypothetical protein